MIVYIGKCFRKAIMLIGVGVIMILLIFMSAGCKDSSRRIDSPADFTGYITQIKLHQDQKYVGTIYAESHADKLVHRCIIEVANNTVFFRKEKNRYISTSFEKLNLQDQIHVWFSTPVQEPYPKYGKARQVVISIFPKD